MCSSPRRPFFVDSPGTASPSSLHNPANRGRPQPGSPRELRPLLTSLPPAKHRLCAPRAPPNPVPLLSGSLRGHPPRPRDLPRPEAPVGAISELLSLAQPVFPVATADSVQGLVLEKKLKADPNTSPNLCPSHWRRPLCRSLIHPAATRRTQRCHTHWPSRPPLETVRWLRTEPGRPPLRPARLLPRRGPSPPSGSALPPRHQSSPHPRQDRQRSLPVGTAEFRPSVRPSVRGGRGAGAEPGFRVILTHRGGRGGPDPWESSACEALLSGAHLKRSSEPPRAAWGTAPEVCGGFKGGGLEPTESQETPSRRHAACSPQRN